MRFGLISVLAATLLCSACGSDVGSPEWCKNTPIEKQTENPAGMAKCLEAETKAAS